MSSELGSLDYLISKNVIKMENLDPEPDINMSDYESPDIMSSDFFDSIMSLEKNNLDGDLGPSLFENMELDLGLTSDGSLICDELQCEASTFSDSGLGSDQHEIAEQILSDEDLLKSILGQTETSTIIEAPEKLALEYPSKTAVLSPTKLPQQTKYINIVKPIPKPKQVIRIQPVSGNSRSVLLPFNIKDLKTIKIINTSNLKAENIKFTPPQTGQNKKTIERFAIQSPQSEPDEGEYFFEDTDCSMKQIVEMNDDGQYPLLALTSEEKRLLNKDGIQLPCRYPLTKHEERELKRIRRKIRNKISAQDSRKRKKEYVDGLEERVKHCSDENRSLMKRIKQLQLQNNKLTTQLAKLQTLVFKTGTSRAHPATCLMIVLLSVMLVTLPNLRNISSDKELNSLQQFVARRALLHSQQATNEDSFNIDEFISFPAKSKNEASASQTVVSNSLNEEEVSEVILSTKNNYINAVGNSHISKLHTHIPIDDHIDGKDLGAVIPDDPPIFNRKATRKRFIDLDVDDYWPPAKKKNVSVANMHVNNCHIII